MQIIIYARLEFEGIPPSMGGEDPRPFVPAVTGTRIPKRLTAQTGGFT